MSETTRNTKARDRQTNGLLVGMCFSAAVQNDELCLRVTFEHDAPNITETNTLYYYNPAAGRFFYGVTECTGIALIGKASTQ